MIGILLNDTAYEQDIRELLMAFYPGETFVHEKQDDVDFYVEGTCSQNADETKFGLKITDPAGTVTDETVFPIDYDVRLNAKTTIKKELYGMLKKRTGKELPWGTLTGIRPTKIAMTRLDQGEDEESIRSFMRDMYLTSEEKIDLSVEVAKRERELLSHIDYETGYSLYVGIPFCPTTCLYCSFTSYPIGAWEKKVHLYLKALFKELDYVAEKMKGRTLDTIYFGGGTPTSLKAEELDALLTKIENTFDLSKVQEFTVEAGRPDSITREKLETLKKWDITRISINPQTMKDETLKIIGRRHTVAQTVESFQLARELGFDDINMDLIMGLPEESLEDVRDTLEQVKALKPDNLTVHSLALKRAARLNMFKEDYKDYKMVNTTEHMNLTAEYAKKMGLEPYYLYRQKSMAGNLENVGYASPGKAGIYNILIMEEKQTIVACGAGASTKRVWNEPNPDGTHRIERCENVKDVAQYIARIDEMIERKQKLFAEE